MVRRPISLSLVSALGVDSRRLRGRFCGGSRNGTLIGDLGNR